MSDMSDAIEWTGTETSAMKIRDAVTATEGYCEYRFTTRTTSLYGDELTIDMPQRIVVLKRGEKLAKVEDGWDKADG